MPTSQFDSSLSLAMLKEAINNQEIKLVLAEIATGLQKDILSILIEEEKAGLSPNLDSLAMQHSMGDKYIGALLPDCLPEFLSNTPKGRESLLTAMNDCLQNANTISNHHDFLALMKVIDGMAFMYDRIQTDKKNPIHLRCKDYISPTAEEVDIRAKRKDALFATTYGIGTEIGTDLVLVPKEEKSTGCLSGKARFFIRPVEHRTRTWFEKLADQSRLARPPLPLIASPSNSAAKALMMVHGLNLFLRPNGLFDLDKAQIFANCVMAYLTYCGHHSFLEVIEIWNRQLDFLVIERPEQLPVGIIPNEPTTMPYMAEKNAVERKLPYALIGNYSHFLHPLYCKKVLQRTKEQLVEGLDLRFVDTKVRL